MAHHEIPVILIDGLPVPQIPAPGTLHVDDTVRYTSVDGEVRIEFELPFSGVTDVILEGEIRKMTHVGNFFCKCFVVLPSGAEIGWAPDRPKAGGEHDVRP